MDRPINEYPIQQFVEQMPIAFAIFDNEMRYQAVSRRHLADLAWLFSTEDLSPDKVMGRTFREVSPDMPLRWGDAHDRVLKGDELEQAADFVPRPDGRATWVRWLMKPWRTPDGQIAGALLFSELVTEGVEIKRALAESEARARVTFENAAVGIGHHTPDGRLFRGNKAMARILGWPLNELMTKTLQDVTHPDDLADDLAHLKELSEGKIESYSLNKRDLRKDGSTIWVRRTASAVRKSDGSVDHYVAVIEDISAWKNAEDQVRLLAREANHRVKNLLSLVQVIARHTAAGSPEGFLERFAERIQALAANQDLLGNSQRRSVDVEDLVRAQLAHFADHSGSRIVAHGPRLRLNAAGAQTISLALHELATNAGKYGALSLDDGRVDVTWQSDGDVFTMSWIERDGPPVQSPEHRGFGTIVITAMATQATGGEVQLDYSPSGLTWQLACPAANVIETPK